MKRNLFLDWFLFISIRLLSLFLMAMPVRFALWLGRACGWLLYYLDKKHRALAYTQIKSVFAETKSCFELRRITRMCFQNMSQNLVEALRLPRVNLNYIHKFIQLDGKRNIEEALGRGKGLILLTIHFGSWELSNACCGQLFKDKTYLVFAEEQKSFFRLYRLLNRYREDCRCKVVPAGKANREVLKNLKSNQIVGLVADHGGGKEGILVNFFGRSASTPTGAIRFALRLDSSVIPVVIIRKVGPYHRIIVERPLILERTGNLEKDLRLNLEKINRIFEGIIRSYPEQYHWFYKRWKYTDERSALVLSDGKTGHLRQLQVVTKILVDTLKQRGIGLKVKMVEVRFKNSWHKAFVSLTAFFAGRYHCTGCLWCLRKSLDEESLDSLIKTPADIVISCGWNLAPLNFILSKENLAKSICIMRPGILSTKRFDLVIMPEHDRPPKRENVVATLGAPNLIDEEYLKEKVKELSPILDRRLPSKDLKIGLLIGGDTKDYTLSCDSVAVLLKGLKEILEELDGEILVTTSRRTSSEIENLIKQNLGNYPRCKLLVIANEKNYPQAIGGILGLCQILVVSGESISMVSEAASSGKYVAVFEPESKSIKAQKKHERFLYSLSTKGYVTLAKSEEIAEVIKKIWQKRPPVKTLNDRELIKEAIERIL